MSPRAGARLLATAVVAAIAAVVGAALGAAGTRPYGIESLLAAVLTLSIIAPVVARVLLGRFDPFEPVVTVAGVYLVYCVLGPSLRMFSGEARLIGRDVQPLYAATFAAVIVGVCAMWVGYHLTLGRLLGRWIWPVKTRAVVAPRSAAPLRGVGWGLTAAAVLALLAWSHLEGQSLARFFLPGVLTSADAGTGGTSIAYLFLAIEWFIPAFLILTVSEGFSGPPIKVAYFAFVSIAYTSLGFRYRLIIFWISAFVLAYLRRNRRPGASTLLTGAVVLLAFAGWLGIARAVFKTGAQQKVAAPTAYEVAENSLSDTEVFETFGVVLDAVPARVDYAGVEPYAYVLLQPIPRAIWPEKPYPHFLDKIAQAIGTPAAAEAGAAVPHFGEYYLAFGWAGLVLGMGIFGVICRTLWSWFQVDPLDPWRQVVFAASDAFLVQAIIRGYSPQIVQEWFFIIFPAVVGMYVARGGREPRAAGSSHAPMYEPSPMRTLVGSGDR